MNMMNTEDCRVFMSIFKLDQGNPSNLQAIPEKANFQKKHLFLCFLGHMIIC